MEITLLIPAIISITLTLIYATEGKLASGEPFDATKFAATLAVQLTALIPLFIVGVNPEVIALLPTLISVLIMKAVSYIAKKRTGTI